MTRRLLAAGLIIGAAMLGGCQSRPDVMKELVAQPGVVGEMGYTIQWQQGLGLHPGERLIYVQKLGDRIATLESQNVLSVLDANTGKILWRTKIGSDLERFSKPLRERERDRLVICSETRCFVFDIASGNQLKVIRFPYVASATPVVTGGLVVGVSGTGMVFAYDLSNGLKMWNVQTDGAINVSPALVGTELIVVNNQGTIAAFNAHTGALLWQKHAFGRISTTPATSDLMVYVASEDQSLYAFQRNSGRLRWRYFTQSPLTRPPAVMGDLVVQYVPDLGLVGIDSFSGEKRWNRRVPAAAPLFAREDSLYFWRPGAVFVLSAKDGHTIHSYQIPDAKEVLADDTHPQNLYLVRTDGAIMKIAPK